MLLLLQNILIRTLSLSLQRPHNCVRLDCNIVTRTYGSTNTPSLLLRLLLRLLLLLLFRLLLLLLLPATSLAFNASTPGCAALPLSQTPPLLQPGLGPTTPPAWPADSPHHLLCPCAPPRPSPSARGQPATKLDGSMGRSSAGQEVSGQTDVVGRVEVDVKGS